MNFDCLLHVGYMKTATTYLQAAVFNNSAVGLGVPLDGRGRALIVREVILSDGFTFDAPAISERLKSAARPVQDKGLIPVWSDETFLGEPVTRRYDAHANALRLHAVLPAAKVLITIREQKALAYSMYVEYLRQGGLASLQSFIGTGRENMSMSPILRADYLKFDRAVRFYIELFGNDNVLVLPYEILRKDRAAYFRRLGAFLNIEIDVQKLSATSVHRSVGATANISRYVANRFKAPHPLSSKQDWWGRFVDLGVRLVDRLAPPALDDRIYNGVWRRIRERYETEFDDSNAALSRLNGLDLKGLGYPVA